MRPIKASTTTTTTTTTLPPHPPTPQPRSPWHSPVPYLFGGLAAMLGLIAFALLILACSYWRLSSRIESNDDGERDVEGGNEKGGCSEKLGSEKVYEEKILVIMAGEDKPTFLATPVSTRTSSLADQNQNVENKEGDNKIELGDNKVKVESNDRHETTVVEQENRENQETTQQQNH